MVKGSSVHIPVPWAMTPASHGNAAPPTVDPAFSTPMAVGASRPSASCGTIAMVVGKIGPRQKPSSTSAAIAPAPDGDSQTSVAVAVMPAMQAYIMATVLAPIRAAIGLIRKRPAVSPSQYPLTE
jgi:hypothetical protein